MVQFGKTEFVYIQGKVAWFRANTVDKYNKYSVQIHPIAKDLEVIRDLQSRGLKNVIKKDDDGYYVRFKRPVTKEFKSGKVQTFAPVQVFDKDDKPYEGLVGNGSDATLKLEVYEHDTPAGGKAVAARWVSARIDNLVPFMMDESAFPEQKEGLEGLKEQPAQELWH